MGGRVFENRLFDGDLLAGTGIQLLPEVLPVVHHELLDGQEGVVADVGVFRRQQTHHRLLPVVLLHDTETW